MSLPRAGILACSLLVLLAGCGNPLKPRIDAAMRQVNADRDRFNKIRQEVETDLQKDPDLFKAAGVGGSWRDRLQTDQEKLNDAFADLERLRHRDSRTSLFADVDRYRTSALNDATAMQAEANRWLDLKRNTSAHLKHMQEDYDKVEHADTAPVVPVLEKAEQDWPAKKADLDAKIAALKSEKPDADAAWKDAQAAAAKPDYAALMADQQKLDSLAGMPDLDKKLAGELYQSFDKVLVDLEPPDREKVKTITTQITDATTHQNQTHTQEQWAAIPPTAYDSLQNDIGMTVEHKPAGAYDSEVQTVPQPPGFAYMAPPGQSNQYGYWEVHNGTSVWTWLPEYLLLRELLWNHNYIPVPSYEYDGYWSARRSGRTYYGGGYTLPNAPAPPAPKYGTHGTFTERSYANSRYMNRSGGFAGSQYRNGSGSTYRNEHSAEQPSNIPRDQGHQFGRSPGSAPSGRRFGSPGGSRPRSAPSGRRFGRH